MYVYSGADVVIKVGSISISLAYARLSSCHRTPAFNMISSKSVSYVMHPWLQEEGSHITVIKSQEKMASCGGC